MGGGGDKERSNQRFRETMKKGPGKRGQQALVFLLEKLEYLDGASYETGIQLNSDISFSNNQGTPLRIFGRSWCH